MPLAERTMTRPMESSMHIMAKSHQSTPPVLRCLPDTAARGPAAPVTEPEPAVWA